MREGWWKLWFLKWFSSCRFPQLIQYSVLLFPLLIQERQREGRKPRGKTHTVESGRAGLGFHWVDWRGFHSLNRSTCSSGISRKQSSILVRSGFLPITPWVLMGAWVWSRFLVPSFGVVVGESLLSGLTPGHCWCRCLDQLVEALFLLQKMQLRRLRVKHLLITG